MTLTFHRQQGSALITALFIMALISIAAMAMLRETNVNRRQTELILHANQASLYATGTLAWAMSELNQPNEKQLPDNTPIIFPTAQEGAYTITGDVTSQQGLFNINNLTDATYQNMFSRLVKFVSPSLNDTDINELIKAIADWITPNFNSSTPSYRAPHRPLISLGELKQVKGMTPALFNQLSPYLSALPTLTAIDINNAPLPVLLSLTPTLTADQANKIIAMRKTTRFQTISAFLALDFLKNVSFPTDKITHVSNYFLVSAHVKVDDQSLTVSTLLNRETGAKPPKITVIWQSKGT